MRVLLVANTLPPKDISGVGEQVLQLASGLEACGHEVKILGRGADGAPGPKMLFPLSVVPAFLRELRSFRPDVVQVHESDGALVALATKIMAATVSPRPILVALLQVSYLEEIRAVRPLQYRNEVLGSPGAAERRFQFLRAPVHVVFGCLTAWLADLLLAPSLVTAREIQADYRVGDVGVVPNVTGGLGWDAAGDASSESRDGFLYVGRLRIRKGVEVLLAAMDGLRREYPDVHLKIIGDGEQFEALQAMTERLDLAEHVEFMGRQSPESVRMLVARAAALVVPSIYEGMPLVILEAMERATPVVASAVSGIPEVVIDGETGWLVEKEDPEMLRSALAEVLANGAESEKRGEAGRQRVASNYRPTNAAEVWELEIGRLTGV